MTDFRNVDSQVDIPALERELLAYWEKEGIVRKYLDRNKDSDKKFSFLDGPITANNPMGVHHAWGRTYKDLWQRFYNMRGYGERFQNGFDEQGLWVEVEVEKELGLKSKKDIENLVPGDKFASLEKFVNLCKERVLKFSAIQTEQSKRLGYFMDWEHSYHTSSDENNYKIWDFLNQVNEKGWLYKGHDSVPWCPRCGTAISQHEIESDGYKLVTHESIYFKLPIVDRENEYLLVWTTTPWTLPANIGVAVDEKLDYALIENATGDKLWVAKELVEKVFEGQEKTVVKIVKGKELVGLRYTFAFDDLQSVKEVADKNPEKFHTVVATDERIMPITTTEGTGLVHTAVSAGVEDFQLGKKLGLPLIEVIDEEANYMEGLGKFSGKNAKKDPRIILDYLEEKDKGQWVFKIESYEHRYPTCWRCGIELVWRVVDEWYIAMDKTDESGKTYREQMIEVAKKINWYPEWGLERELDWLKNMHDWLISKKRYWGLSLPVWECKCGSFEVVGSKEELQERAVEGWDQFEGHSPHRPWVDQVKIKCSKCDKIIERIHDVGNPWLDAGIVPFSTLPEGWFPADLVSESFPGQFKNWFYAMIAMSTVLKGTNPFKNLFGYALVKDEKGEEMHKSKGNSIEFNEAADKIGADVMRWMYATQNPETNLNFGFNVAAEVKRKFYLILWNSYKFFLVYATTTGWQCEMERGEMQIIDRWVLASLTDLVEKVNKSLDSYQVADATRMIESFVGDDLSTWYIRRNRSRVGMEAEVTDRNLVMSILFGNLVTLSKLLAPFMPFLAEEMYRNLTGGDTSVHLQDFPKGDASLLDPKLIEEMKIVREVVENGHKARQVAGVKLRQPLTKAVYRGVEELSDELRLVIKDELNVKEVEYGGSDGQLSVELNTKLSEALEKEGEARELIRQIQVMRKEMGLKLQDQIKVIYAPKWPKEFEKEILEKVSAKAIKIGESLKLEV